MDIYENTDEVLVMVDLPGVAREHVSIDLNKDRLTLTARRERPADGNAPPRFEPFDYYRAFIVPPGLDPEGITAELSGGVLRVKLPKSPALKPRRIEVRSA